MIRSSILPYAPSAKALGSMNLDRDSYRESGVEVDAAVSDGFIEFRSEGKGEG